MGRRDHFNEGSDGGFERQHGPAAWMAPISKLTPDIDAKDIRALPGDNADWHGVSFDDLKSHIASHGIQEALWVGHHPESGKVIVTQGNHRLHAARELGLSHVPVTDEHHWAADLDPVPEEHPVRK